MIVYTGEGNLIRLLIVSLIVLIPLVLEFIFDKKFFVIINSLVACAALIYLLMVEASLGEVFVVALISLMARIIMFIKGIRR